MNRTQSLVKLSYIYLRYHVRPTIPKSSDCKLSLEWKKAGHEPAMMGVRMCKVKKSVRWPEKEEQKFRKAGNTLEFRPEEICYSSPQCQYCGLHPSGDIWLLSPPGKNITRRTDSLRTAAARSCSVTKQNKKNSNTFRKYKHFAYSSRSRSTASTVSNVAERRDVRLLRSQSMKQFLYVFVVDQCRAYLSIIYCSNTSLLLVAGSKQHCLWPRWE